MKRLFAFCLACLLVLTIAYAEAPKYDGRAITDIGEPQFTMSPEIGQIIYKSIDRWQRTAGASGILGPETIETDTRNSIQSIEPSGWQQNNYEFIPGLNLYQRCHLIGHQLGGEEILENLVTGTQYLNILGMLPIENKIAEYIQRTGNHVKYEATPYYGTGYLLCYGVIIDAQSIEDDEIHFSVYCHNVQPGVKIDYATGMNGLADTTTFIAYVEPDETMPARTVLSSELTYVLNTNTHRFHYPSCSSVEDIKPKNKQQYSGDRESLIKMGYKPCGRCNP